MGLFLPVALMCTVLVYSAAFGEAVNCHQCSYIAADRDHPFLANSILRGSSESCAPGNFTDQEEVPCPSECGLSHVYIDAVVPDSASIGVEFVNRQCFEGIDGTPSAGQCKKIAEFPAALREQMNADLVQMEMFGFTASLKDAVFCACANDYCNGDGIDGSFAEYMTSPEPTPTGGSGPRQAASLVIITILGLVSKFVFVRYIF